MAAATHSLHAVGSIGIHMHGKAEVGGGARNCECRYPNTWPRHRCPPPRLRRLLRPAMASLPVLAPATPVTAWCSVVSACSACCMRCPPLPTLSPSSRRSRKLVRKRPVPADARHSTSWRWRALCPPCPHTTLDMHSRQQHLLRRQRGAAGGVARVPTVLPALGK